METSTTANDLFKISVTHPRSGKTFDAEAGPGTTGREILTGLLEEHFLEPAERGKEYVLSLARTGQTIPLDGTLGAAGVRTGDTLGVTLVNEGAARLTPHDLRSRLKLDGRTVAGLASPHLGDIRAFADSAAEREGRAVRGPELEAGAATIYHVGYRCRLATSPTSRIDRTVVRFDLLAEGNYPFTPPAVQAISTPLPFSVRVHPSTGTICIGSGWKDDHGQMLLAQLIVHVMRLLNYDEPCRGNPRDSFNAEASAFWKETLCGGPLNPDLVYPALPAHLTHGVARAPGIFRRAASAPAARPRGSVAFRRTP